MGQYFLPHIFDELLEILPGKKQQLATLCLQPQDRLGPGVQSHPSVDKEYRCTQNVHSKCTFGSVANKISNKDLYCLSQMSRPTVTVDAPLSKRLKAREKSTAFHSQIYGISEI